MSEYSIESGYGVRYLLGENQFYGGHRLTCSLWETQAVAEVRKSELPEPEDWEIVYIVREVSVLPLDAASPPVLV